MKASCACGGVAITVASSPRLHAVCHCTNCKRRTGSAFGVSTYFERSAVSEIAGETRIYAFRDAQGNEQQRHFCTRCGTTLYWFTSALPDRIGIAAGCFGEEEALPEPSMSVSDARRKPWVSLPRSWKVYSG